MEKLQHDFLWSGIGEEFKFHLVGWDKVCNPLRDGGLGVRNVRILSGALWKWGIDLKYGREMGSWCSKEGRGSYGVRLWKFIQKGWDSFASNTRLSLGDGRRIRFWKDCWVGDTVLLEAYPAIYNIARDLDAMVADLRVTIQDSQEWNISLNREVHDWEVNMLVDFFNLLYNIPVAATTEDVMIWRPSKKGKFTVRSFYNSITGQQ
ncbi:hypothetical protein I3760_13G121400 [Carya illinoinensis]|nr:hypothetical protein I3760_13G121400 [Carya illinoinensis]